MIDAAVNRLLEMGLTEDTARLAVAAGLCLSIFIVAYIVDFIVQRILIRLIQSFAKRTATQWDDALVDRGAARRIANLAPALVVHLLAPIALAGWPQAITAVKTGVLVYMTIVTLLIIDALMNAVLDVYEQKALARRFPLRTFIQAFKVVLAVVGVILVLSLLVGRSPVYFFSGLGAFTAVLLIVFRDSILGFVAGIQLTANNMVAVGDWIAMPAYGADGTVLEVSLTTVKVQNWDKTITTIPTYALISDSFKNWRGMEDSGGRRIKRSIGIDMTSVRICDDAMIDRFRKFAFIADYIDGKQRELETWNRENPSDSSELINGRRMTNLGTFRAYVEAYLRSHPQVRDDMTFIVRQLAPGPEGVQMEIYVFSREQRWAHYEAIQADIFDHIIAVVPEFELRVFQNPTGSDFRGLNPAATT
jgi:miniconductance mechanosensitive channel